MLNTMESFSTVRVYAWKERRKGTCKEEMFRKFFILSEYLHVRLEVLTVVTYEEYLLSSVM
jgi:hypothetical protein